MIVGFVDTTGNFQDIRGSCILLGLAIVGVEPIARPKNLMHAILGRVLAMIPHKEMNVAQRKGMAYLIRDYNTHIVLQEVERMKKSSQLRLLRIDHDSICGLYATQN